MMYEMMINKWLFFFILFFNISLYSAFEFSDTDAQSIAISGANTASPVGTSAIIANPAHLPLFKKRAFSASVISLSRALENGHILQFSGNLIVPFAKINAMGFSFKGHHVKVGPATFNEYEIAAGYGINIGSIFQLGTTGIVQILNISSDTGASISFPVTFNATAGLSINISKQYSFGFVFADMIAMNTAPNGSNAKENVPRKLKSGFAIKKNKFNSLIDVKYVFELEELTFSYGHQFLIRNKKFSMGTGLAFITQQNVLSPSIGFNLTFNIFHIHYAIAYPIPLTGGAGVAGNHIFTLVKKF